MKNRRNNVIPMSVPAIGNQQQMVDLSQAVQKQCKCGSMCFDKAFRIAVVSKLAPGNRIQDDVVCEVGIYICRECGQELRPLEGEGQSNDQKR